MAVPEQQESAEAPVKTFLSYSRRQLYFAESLALHLQNGGIEIWFDLQRLTPGTVWSKGLTDGVEAADRLILVVSKAALESPYTRQEWEAVVDGGRDVVLVIYEPVELPEKLAGCPAYDFRRDFGNKLEQLLAFLKGEVKPRHDPVPAPGRLGVSLTAPLAVHLTLLALFLPVFAGLLGLIGSFREVTDGGPFFATIFWGSFGLSLALGARYAIPFWRHRIDYRALKRGMLASLMLWLLTCFAALPGAPLAPILAGSVGVAGLYVYFWTLRRSIDLLRWLQPQDSLQALRRRVHGPLFEKTGLQLDLGTEADARSVTYAIHADAADRPLGRHLERVFEAAGHNLVDASADPAHHLAILSNRTSEADAQRIARDHGGNVIFIVASTIEFRGSLKDVGSYQWVDFRDGDRRDLETLASSLRDPQGAGRESALEVTPDKIDRWKVPGGVTLLKRFMQVYGGWLLISGLIPLLGIPLQLLLGESLEDPRDSIAVTLAGGVLIWLTTRGLVYRKVPALLLYGLLLGAILGTTVVSRLYDGRIFLMNPQLRWGWGIAELLPLAVGVPILLASVPAARYWFPAFAEVHADEVGIKASIQKRMVRRQTIFVGTVVILILGGVAYFFLLGPGRTG